MVGGRAMRAGDGRAAAALGLLLLASLGLALLQARPRPGRAVVALFRPGRSAAAVLGAEAAGWRPLHLLALRPFGTAVARPEGPAARPAALYCAGAWLVLGWPGAGGCSFPEAQGTTGT